MPICRHLDIIHISYEKEPRAGVFERTTGAHNCVVSAAVRLIDRI
jgi:hypothetical protein